MSSDSNHHTALSSSPSPSSASSSSSSSPPSPSPPNPVSSLDLHANILFDYVFRPQNTSTTIQSGRGEWAFPSNTGPTLVCGCWDECVGVGMSVLADTARIASVCVLNGVWSISCVINCFLVLPLPWIAVFVEWVVWYVRSLFRMSALMYIAIISMLTSFILLSPSNVTIVTTVLLSPSPSIFISAPPPETSAIHTVLPCLFLDCQTHVNAILEQAKALDDIFQSHINPSASAISSASASASSLPSTQEPSAGSSNGASQLRQVGDSKAQAPAPVKEEKTDTTATEQDRYLAALKLEIQALRQEIREKDGLISVYAGKTKEWRRKFGALVDTNDATMKSALMMWLYVGEARCIHEWMRGWIWTRERVKGWERGLREVHADSLPRAYMLMHAATAKLCSAR